MIGNLKSISDVLTLNFEKVSKCVFNDKQNSLTVIVDLDCIIDVCKFLKYDRSCRFEQLIDLCCVDYLTYKKDEDDFSGKNIGPGQEIESRFAVVYHLLSLTNNHRIRLKVFVNVSPLVVPSIVSIWKSADWYEREAFDLYGVEFSGRSDLNRILTDYGFNDHPLRKDFPLIGKQEMHYSDEQKKVVYDTVKISQRKLIPKVYSNK